MKILYPTLIIIILTTILTACVPQRSDTVSDPALIAQPDSSSTDQNHGVTINVLANDNGLGNNPIILTIATEPSHGSLQVNTDNSIIYTPVTNYYGSDTFNYQITDSNGDSAIASVTVTVNCIINCASSTMKNSISQWGITWTFDKAYPSGQFVNGDWWVIGPVTIISVNPGPSQGNPEEEVYNTGGNQFGDAALQVDNQMRNGSMVISHQNASQGYDSRVINYNPSLSLEFPFTLSVNQSLISTESLKNTVGNNNFVVGHFEDSWSVLKTAVVLTSLDTIPPQDAFRPSYAGDKKTIYRVSDLRTELLPQLQPVGNAPSLKLYERYFERVWPDHTHNWTQGKISPLENMPGYGREYARVTSQASLLLSLDIPLQQKMKLLTGFVQLGIDLAGMAQFGGTWPAEGGIWEGRKWPIVFSSILLNDSSMVPEITSIDPRFSEDQHTYYGTHFNGIYTSLFQMGLHHGLAYPYEHKDPATWTLQDERSESYRTCCTGNSWVGTALVARYMNAIANWGHNAFFDYVDRYMDEFGQAWYADTFVTAMWNEYRASAPEQELAPLNLMFTWDNGGTWVLNL